MFLASTGAPCTNFMPSLKMHRILLFLFGHILFYHTAKCVPNLIKLCLPGRDFTDKLSWKLWLTSAACWRQYCHNLPSGFICICFDSRYICFFFKANKKSQQSSSTKAPIASNAGKTVVLLVMVHWCMLVLLLVPLSVCINIRWEASMCSVRIHFCTSVAHNAFVQIGQCTCAEMCLIQCAGSCEA